MGVSFMGIAVLLVAVLGGGAIVVSIISRLFRRGGDNASESSSIQVARGVTLNCPHCGAETDASQHECQHCRQDM
ncbi:MAG: hypothetical protein O3B13_15800 [Planctomycetota bacterium]|nr:hypothetical protein [Planctomycetota bacterium]MDA1164555.1 hypothetical protein [Planctomycetota bacterium]